MNLLRHLTPSEKTLLAFVGVSFTRLLFLGNRIHWQELQLAGFPYLEFGFLVLAAAVIKFPARSPGATFLSLLLLGTSHAGFSGISPFLTLLSWPLLGLWLLWYGMGCKQRKVSASALFGWIRESMPLFSLILAYPLIPVIITSANPADLDTLLLGWDQLLFRTNPHLWLEKQVPLPLMEWMALCYSSYIFLFLGVLGSLLIRRSETGLREMIFRTCLCLAIGYTLYWAVPAVGPESVVTFEHPLRIVQFADLKYALMDRPRIARDCFPSLHTAITTIAACSAWRHLRALFWVLLPGSLCVHRTQVPLCGGRPGGPAPCHRHRDTEQSPVHFRCWEWSIASPERTIP